MVREGKASWKNNYFLKLLKLVDEFPKCFIVGVDNVGSRQMQEIRTALRGHAEILMGKNTMIRKAIRGHLQKNPSLEKLLPHIVGNVGFVFTKDDLPDVKDKILGKKIVPTPDYSVAEEKFETILTVLRTKSLKRCPLVVADVIFFLNTANADASQKYADAGGMPNNRLRMRKIMPNMRIRIFKTQLKVAAPAKAGAIAPIDVILPAQNTGLGPEKTSFFQALSIPTKISKGTIEILNDVHLIKKNEKVGASEATLLNMLGIFPFTYGLIILQVFDSGTIFSPEVLDITQEDLRNKFLLGVRNVASLCLAINYPTIASVPHLIANGVKNLMAVAAESDVTFKQAEKLKEYLKDPSKFAAAVAAVAPAKTAEAKKEAPKKEEKKAESDEEEGDMGFGLFD